MDRRVYNFSAGPSMLPEPALKQAAAEMLNYRGSGMSVMEMSHRSSVYQSIIDETEALLRSVMNIPDDYAVLFLQGGASTQFAMVPLNLMKTGLANYAVTGEFSQKAAEEAKKYGTVQVAVCTEGENFRRIPRPDELSINSDADYFHLCGNNTIYGTRWSYLPDVGAMPLVADLSSEILSRPVDVRPYGLIYAGAQKNMGPAGVTCVIVRRSLIEGDPMPAAPTMLSYKKMAASGSMYNTPPTYGIYMLGLVLSWVQELGGLAAMEERNLRKAALLYDYLDESRLFVPLADRDSRSIMNVTFRTENADMDKQFVAEAAAHGLLTLKGHRKAGGLRASIYNAMPEEGVRALVDFMAEFEKARR